MRGRFYPTDDRTDHRGTAAAAVSRPRPPSRTEMQGTTPKARLSIRIDSEFGCKIETKQIVLLETIKSQGSISRAAQFLGLSYRGTQNLIEVINTGLREPAVSTVSGGREGGGAALTPIGIQLVELYRAIEARAQAVALPEREALHSLIRPKKISAD
jgi:molybdate transport system regulatory protein